MLASAAAGQPGSPSRPEISPSWQQASRSGELRVLGVLGDDPVEGPDVLQRPAHQPGVGHAVPVVGEHPDAGPPDRAISPSSASSAPGQALAHRAHRHDLGVPVPPAQRRHVLGRLGGVGDRVGVGHGQHGGEPAAGRRLRCR